MYTDFDEGEEIFSYARQQNYIQKNKRVHGIQPSSCPQCGKQE